MDPATWNRVRSIVETALELPEGERRAFVERESDGDAELREQVQRMLNADATGAAFLAPPVLEPVPATQALASGQRIGDYRVLHLIGSGGMGAVYAAEHVELGRRVALKLLPSAHASSSALRRFRDEVQMLARLRHPRIAQVYEAGTATLGGAEVPWFAMELVEDGRDLIAFANTEQASLEERLRLFTQLCEAVEHGHGRGVLHRDLKPSNVLVDGEGRVRLIDFGIARALEGSGDDSAAHTITGWLIGTPQCMAPEQFSEDERDLDVRCDVYALGALLYQLLTRVPPHDFTGKSLAAITRTLNEVDPVRPSTLASDLPPDLEWIVLKALEKDRSLRYPTVSALAEDLRRLRDNEPVSVGPPTVRYRLAKFARRNRILVIGGTAAFAGLLLAVVGTSIGLIRAKRAEADARSAETIARDAEASARAAEADALESAAQALSAEQAARASEAEALRESEKNAVVLNLVRGIFDGAKNTLAGRDVRVLDLLDVAKDDLAARDDLDPEVEWAFRSMLGSLYLRLDRFDTALEQLELAEALRVDLSADALDPSQVAQAVMQLGTSELRGGKPTEGRARLLEAIELADRADNDDLRLVSRVELLEYIGDTGDYHELRDRATALLALAQELDNETAELRALSFIGRSESNLGNDIEAVSYFREVAARTEALKGDSHATGQALAALASALVGGRDDSEALEVNERALDMLARHLGESNNVTLGSLAIQAALVFRTGNAPDAGVLYQRMIDIYEARDEPPTVTMMVALHNLGTCHLMQKQFQLAEPPLRRAVELADRMLEEDDINRALFRMSHGVTLGWLDGHFDEAEGKLLSSFEVMTETFPADHPRIHNAIDKIGIFYNTNGEEDEANWWWDKLPEERDPRLRKP